ncbi:MAG: type 2 lanthipeptide synthetase LanM family protein [Coleofasciculus sp. D1-CHI-01]|uniref:type 2 lanthipeptide synthetase LanM family protein n=1 Tax=Coleofasciculus sp. D1-CHI-01 TaxID=3068482 RepID=UPI0032FDAD1C
MDRVIGQTAPWYRALTLIERIPDSGTIREDSDTDGFNQDLAERKMQRWCSQIPFTNSAYFDQRLAIEGMTREQFRDRLGESVESLVKRFPHPPHWLEELQQAFSRPNFTNVQIAPVAQLSPERATLGFLYGIKPLLSHAIARLDAGIGELEKRYPTLPFDRQTIKGLLVANLPDQLITMISQTMVLELNVARLQGQLSGETPTERLHNFIQELDNPERAIALLQEYPVLARQLVIHLEQWVDASLEFLDRLCSDWQDICQTFTPQTHPGILVQVQQGAGDTHRGGRSVMILKFSSGFQVVYKPKSLAIDCHFQELLQWLNQRGKHPPFLTLKIINRDTYGWVEFLSASSCTTLEQLERFYWRMGGYLALFYVLEATDFHLENLIAAGEHPVPIDLETLFRPVRSAPDSPAFVLIANRKMGESVMGVGLLPQRTNIQEASPGIDTSGIGAIGGQTLPTQSPQLTGIGTDEMRVRRQPGRLNRSKNRPTLNGDVVNVLDYQEAIETGFATIYRLIKEHQEDFCSTWITTFAQDEIRVVLRDTRLYGLLLQESFHPDVLRDALDRDRLFDRLWVDVPNRPFLDQVIPWEKKALWRGDIPLFSTHVNSCDLWSDGERITNFFDQSGIERVERRIRQLSETDLDEQRWFIRTALTALKLESQNPGHSSYHLVEPETIPDPKQLCKRLLQIAGNIASRLESLALHDNHQASWIGLVSVSQGYWTLKPLSWDLFAGISGIALFLGYFGAMTQTERYEILARDALSTVLRQVEFDQNLIRSIGGFSGWGGLIYTVTHLGSLWQNQELYDRALKWVNQLPKLIEQDKQLDIVYGSAGCIIALMNLYRCIGNEDIKAVALQCGERLLACAQPMERGIGWVTIPHKKPLGGFSHGAAGIALALLELAAFTGEERYKNAAVAALEYERSLFSEPAKNWRNRLEEDEENFAMGWSHGATGIGLARWRMSAYLDDPEIYSEIDAARETTLNRGFGYNHSLCNGDLGNLELLWRGNFGIEVENESQELWHKRYLQKTAAVLDSLEQQGCYCGVPGGTEVLGLMNGLAGIGYGLLRLVHPDRVPSVLVLDPPISRHSQGTNLHECY